MLSEKEKRWVFWGGGIVGCLLYLFLVLFPLYSFQGRMQKRIQRGWRTGKQLETGLRQYKSVNDTTRLLMRRAKSADRKVAPEQQLRSLVKRIAGGVEIRRQLKWEGPGVVLATYFLKTRVSPVQVFDLIQRIDHHYLPLRVVTWTYQAAEDGRGVLTMEIASLEKEAAS